MTKETLTSNRNDFRNRCKATKINSGKIDQKQQNELENYRRLQSRRVEVLEEANATKVINQQAHSDINDIKSYKAELIGRVQHEKQLIETLNKIVQKLNFERSEEEHQAKLQLVELKAAKRRCIKVKGDID